MNPIQAFFEAFAAHPFWSAVLVGAGLSLANLITSHVMGKPRLRALGLDYDGRAWDSYDGPNAEGVFCGLQWLWAVGGLIAAAAEFLDGASYMVPGMSGVVAEVLVSGALAYGVVLTAILGFPDLVRYFRAKQEASALEAQRSAKAIHTHCTTLANMALAILLPGRREFYEPLVTRCLEALRLALEVRDRMEARGAFDPERISAAADALHPGSDARLPEEAKGFLRQVAEKSKARKVTLGDIRALVERFETFFVALEDALPAMDPSVLEGEVTILCQSVERFGVAVADPQIALPARDPELDGLSLDGLELDPSPGRERQAN